MRLKTLIVIHVVLPLALGGLIYVSFRSHSLRLFNWFEIMGIGEFTSHVRYSISPLKMYLPSWIYFSLPDGLWVYSFSAMLYFTWNELFLKFKILLTVPFFITIFIEIFQNYGIINGTFDFMDLLISLNLNILLVINLKLYKNEKIN